MRYFEFIFYTLVDPHHCLHLDFLSDFFLKFKIPFSNFAKKKELHVAWATKIHSQVTTTTCVKNNYSPISLPTL
jgi:uncharacterized protein (DUF362 family)